MKLHAYLHYFAIFHISSNDAFAHPTDLSILTAIFPGKPGLAGFIEAKDDGGDGW